MRITANESIWWYGHITDRYLLNIIERKCASIAFSKSIHDDVVPSLSLMTLIDRDGLIRTLQLTPIYRIRELLGRRLVSAVPRYYITQPQVSIGHR